MDLFSGIFHDRMDLLSGIFHDRMDPLSGIFHEVIRSSPGEWYSSSTPLLQYYFILLRRDRVSTTSTRSDYRRYND
jgi:hypothetical protein